MDLLQDLAGLWSTTLTPDRGLHGASIETVASGEALDGVTCDKKSPPKVLGIWP